MKLTLTTFILLILSVASLQAQDPFITIWKTDNAGDSNDDQITIPTAGSGYNYDVYWEDVTDAADNGMINGNTGDLTITFPDGAGTYRVEIAGDFPAINFANTGDKEKILTIEQWGDIEWESMNNAFSGASNLQINATDAPDLSGVDDLSAMFSEATSLNSDLNDWDVSTITNMNGMFYGASGFNGDISGWDVSNVTSMISMFLGAAAFDQNLGGWNVSSVIYMQNMLSGSGLSIINYDFILNSWAQGSIQNNVTLGAAGLAYCFGARSRNTLMTDFNWTITDDALAAGCHGSTMTPFATVWNTVEPGTSGNNQITIPTDAGSTYSYSVVWQDATNPAINGIELDVTGDLTITFPDPGAYIIGIIGEFPRIYFNNGGDKEKFSGIFNWGDIEWTSMENAFFGASNMQIVNSAGAPDLTNVTSMSSMFRGASSLNSDLNHWDVSNVENMLGLFWDASSFNGDITNWNVSNVNNMQTMFSGAVDFDQDISTKIINAGTPDEYEAWDVSNVTLMGPIFLGAESFNQDISNWDVSNVTHMASMFNGASVFNRDISGWDVSNVTNMSGMFTSAFAFDQNLGGWNIENVADMNFMLHFSGLSIANYDATLIGWASQNVNSGIDLGATGLEYCAGQAARQTLMDPPNNWTITGDALGAGCGPGLPFITTWQTDNDGDSNDDQITIPTNGFSVYDYDVYWEDVMDASNNGSIMSNTGDLTITFPDGAGTYRIEITGDFPAIRFNNGGDKDKILTVEQWGDIEWENMNDAFFGASNLQVTATDAPNLSAVEVMNGMFLNATSLNSDFDHWDVSNVTKMLSTFLGATSFNGNISSWDVSNVTSMNAMFQGAVSFNGDITSWNVGNITDMVNMFTSAFAFDQNLGGWNIENVANMNFMLNSSGLSTDNYDATLTGWAGQTVQSGVDLGADGLEYCASEADRQALIDDDGWTITGDALASGCNLPEGEDQRILAGNPGGHTFSAADFGIANPDFSVKIETLPGKGELLEDGIAVAAGTQVSVNVLSQNRLTWNPPAGNDHGYNYTSFEFRIVDDNANESDDAYTMTIDLGAASVELTGDEGWRFMTNPSVGDTYGGFLDPIWTKGVPGSDSPGASVPNIYTLDQPNYQWKEISAMSNSFSRGEAFIVYVFSDDDNDGTPEGFPKTLTGGQNWQTLENEFSYSNIDYAPGQGPSGDSHFLIANPHPVSLDFCGFTSTNIATSAYFWNPEAGGGNGDYMNLNCAVEDVFIAPFQGFWVRTTDANPVLEIPEVAYLGSAEEGYFKQKEDLTGLANLSGLTFTVQSADGIFTNTTRILFSEEASEGLDEWDAPKLSPAGLAARWLSFYSLDEQGKAYALQSLPQNFDEKISIPLDVQTTEAGEYILRWELPGDAFAGSYYLRDNQTGEVIELREGVGYRFEIAPDQTSKVSETLEVLETAAAFFTQAEPRFELLVTVSGVDGFTELGAIPEAFELAQNYPNPFNPTTVISYQLPAGSEVRLEVYDMLGRRVASLVEGQIAAGRHTVNFDASSLSSGVYLYRLQAGNNIITKKLTVVK